MLQARQGHARLLATRALLRSPEHLSTQGGNEVAESQVLGHERTATVRLGWDLLQVLLRQTRRGGRLQGLWRREGPCCFDLPLMLCSLHS